jgi:hypothetical protein
MLPDSVFNTGSAASAIILNSRKEGRKGGREGGRKEGRRKEGRRTQKRNNFGLNGRI